MRIKNLGQYRNGLTYSPQDVTDETDGTLVLRSSNIKDGKLELNDNVYVKGQIPSDLMVKQGDILICSRNGSRELIGKNALLPDMKASFGAFMMIYRCVNPSYMYYVLNSPVFNYYLGSFFTSTINQLTGNNFGNMKIPYCPDVEEQRQIADFLDSKCAEIDALSADIQSEIETLETYKRSVIIVITPTKVNEFDTLVYGSEETDSMCVLIGAGDAGFLRVICRPIMDSQMNRLYSYVAASIQQIKD